MPPPIHMYLSTEHLEEAVGHGGHTKQWSWCWWWDWNCCLSLVPYTDPSVCPWLLSGPGSVMGTSHHHHHHSKFSVSVMGWMSTSEHLCSNTPSCHYALKLNVDFSKLNSNTLKFNSFCTLNTSLRLNFACCDEMMKGKVAARDMLISIDKMTATVWADILLCLELLWS